LRRGAGGKIPIDSAEPGGQASGNMKKTDRAAAQELTWDEIGFICEGLVLAPRPQRDATRSITEEYSLGPRGAWIAVLISIGEVVFPLDLTKFFHIGRSLITAELTRLSDAGLIVYRKSENDGRRVQLVLTPLGHSVQRRVKAELTKLVTRGLASYTHEQALLFGRMLHDFGKVTPNDDKVFQHLEGMSSRSGAKPRTSRRKRE
jgi:DNA-binding MarR family transcriptional regulator